MVIARHCDGGNSLQDEQLTSWLAGPQNDRAQNTVQLILRALSFSRELHADHEDVRVPMYEVHS